MLITLKIKSDDDKVPVQGHVFTFVMNFILFLLVVDHDALTFAMRHLTKLQTNVTSVGRPGCLASPVTAGGQSNWFAPHIRGGLWFGPTRVFVISPGQHEPSVNAAVNIPNFEESIATSGLSDARSDNVKTFKYNEH